MNPDDLSEHEAADILFFEAESPDGFRVQLEHERRFLAEGWQNLWQAVASLVSHNNGSLDVWASYDLSRVIGAVQEVGMTLQERPVDSLDEFEEKIAAANMFVNEIFGAS